MSIINTLLNVSRETGTLPYPATKITRVVFKIIIGKMRRTFAGNVGQSQIK